MFRSRKINDVGDIFTTNSKLLEKASQYILAGIRAITQEKDQDPKAQYFAFIAESVISALATNNFNKLKKIFRAIPEKSLFGGYDVDPYISYFWAGAKEAMKYLKRVRKDAKKYAKSSGVDLDDWITNPIDSILRNFDRANYWVDYRSSVTRAVKGQIKKLKEEQKELENQAGGGDESAATSTPVTSQISLLEAIFSGADDDCGCGPSVDELLNSYTPGEDPNYDPDVTQDVPARYENEITPNEFLIRLIKRIRLSQQGILTGIRSLNDMTLSDALFSFESIYDTFRRMIAEDFSFIATSYNEERGNYTFRELNRLMNLVQTSIYTIVTFLNSVGSDNSQAQTLVDNFQDLTSTMGAIGDSLKTDVDIETWL